MENFEAGVCALYYFGVSLLGIAEQFRLGLGHGQVNLSATLALRRNRTLRVRPAEGMKKKVPF